MSDADADAPSSPVAAAAAAPDEHVDGNERVIDKDGASLELIRRVRFLRTAFLADRLVGAPKDEYKLFEVTVKKETTVLANRGLRLRSLADESMLFFHCVCGACFMGTEMGGKIQGSQNVRKYTVRATSNVTNHLKSVHHVESSKTKLRSFTRARKCSVLTTLSNTIPDVSFKTCSFCGASLIRSQSAPSPLRSSRRSNIDSQGSRQCRWTETPI